jgi:predicted TIM-barrel fold metal-dependent hydrolase
MDRYDVDISCVSSANAIFYKDSQKGNEELSDEIKKYSSRFIGLAVINPAYTGWKRDFFDSIRVLGMKGIELYPYYHKYKLTDAASLELLKLAGENGVPVHLPCAVENIRQRHWMDTEENLNISDVAKAVKQCPDTDFLITNGPSNAYAGILAQAGAGRRGSIYFDFARLDSFNGSLQSLIDIVGIDHVVFGTAAPFQYIDPQFVKLNYSGLSEDDKNRILSENLKKVFKL